MRDLKPKILFVDDEELARRTFQRIADKEFRVLLAESVDEAIDILEREHHDIGVLLSDQRMPGRLGVDLLEHCRKHYPKIIRMLTTAYSELNDAIAAVNRGEIMRYIEKPWGNIDGLLIDLRVAMSLFEMRAENEHLIAEKLSTGYKTSRLDKIRMLVSIAGCQPGEAALQAAESLLRQVAEVEAYRELPALDDMQSFQMFGQPINDSITSIEIGSYISSQSARYASIPGWAEIAGPGAEGISLANAEAAEESSGDVLAQSLAELKTVFGSGSSISAELEKNENGLLLKATPLEGDVSVLAEWLTGRSQSVSLSRRVAALLQIFLLVSAEGGHVRMSLNQLGLIEAIHLHFYGDPENIGSGTTNGYDWIDDLLILFS